MLLTDADLEKILSKTLDEEDPEKLIIAPFEDACLTPVGYDLRVGDVYTTSDRVGKHALADGQKIVIKPNSTALITTLEDVRMPRSGALSGFIASKVREVSRGLSHISTTIDADWEGKLLIAVHNPSMDRIALQHGQTFATLVLLENRTAPKKKCDKTPGRIDILLEDFSTKIERAKKIRTARSLIAPAVVVAGSILGYWIFGNTAGFAASVAASAAISQFVQTRL